MNRVLPALALLAVALAPIADAAPPSREDGVALLQTLTPQQGRILELVCGGMLNKQIAHEMSIAETTVKAHITAILRKLKVQSRTQAALLAQEARLNSVLREG